jgi:hypothetical protein
MDSLTEKENYSLCVKIIKDFKGNHVDELAHSLLGKVHCIVIGRGWRYITGAKDEFTPHPEPAFRNRRFRVYNCLKGRLLLVQEI